MGSARDCKPGSGASLAVLLAAGGLFAALSASVTQRTREIGVRLALGSSPARIFTWTVTQGLGLILTGVAVGLVAALAATRSLSSLLYKVSPTDGLTLVAVAVVVTVTALTACCVPAARAAYIDPCESLKSS